MKIQLVLIVLVLAGLAFYFFGGYAKKISDLKSDAYDKVHSATDETFRSSQTSLVYDTNGNIRRTRRISARRSSVSRIRNFISIMEWTLKESFVPSKP